MKSELLLNNVKNLLNAELDNPRSLLGPQVCRKNGKKAVSVRMFLPASEQVWLRHPAYQFPRAMQQIHPAGLFEGTLVLSESQKEDDYQFIVADRAGQTTTMHDPYSFESYFTNLDLHLFGEGSNLRIYGKLGAQIRCANGVQGVNFAVWAPNAKSISLVGGFNGWDGRQHPMTKLIPSGIWELFVPGLSLGEIYKFRIRENSGRVVDKSDPYGFSAEIPPKTASVVTDLDRFQWNDAVWMDARKKQTPQNRPVSIYEVHLGSWRRQSNDQNNGWKNYRELAHELVEYCLQQHFTHVELMPVTEHPFTGSWGYQTVGYFAATSRYGSPEDFMYFVDYFHQHGIGVILDWVPAHFPKDESGLGRFDGTALYEHQDPRKGEHPDWGTLIFNYGRNEVRNFLLSNALFWMDKFHIDGLRVDAVASMLYLDYSRHEGEWIPNENGGRENLDAISLLKRFNEVCHAEYPGVMTIAEESTSFAGVSRPTFDGGLGFSIKWNMGWMNDTLRYMAKDPVYREFHHEELTFSLVYAFSENFMLPLSHDEVVHGKKSLLGQMPGESAEKFANLRLLYSLMWTHPGKKLLFMGNEIAQWKEFDHDCQPQWELLDQEPHRGVQRLVGDLNRLYCDEPALHHLDFDANGFEWIDCQNGKESQIAFVRRSLNPDDLVVVICNFTPIARTNYRLGVPKVGVYKEIFNSDSTCYGGSRPAVHPLAKSEQIVAQGRDHSIEISVPALGMAMFKPESMQ